MRRIAPREPRHRDLAAKVATKPAVNAGQGRSRTDQENALTCAMNRHELREQCAATL
jgi:hypothetical protein